MKVLALGISALLDIAMFLVGLWVFLFLCGFVWGFITSIFS